MLSSILWDNDGVLVDTERYYFQANRDYLRRFGIELTEENFFQWYLCENRGAWHLLDENASDDQIACWRQERNLLHLDILARAGSLLTPGVEYTLAKLSGRFDMGIVTSATRSSFEAIHGRHDILRYFRFVLTSETYAQSKPSPEPYLLGLKHLGHDPGQCLVIEDSPRGLQAALAAGLRCIILRNPLTRGHAFSGAWSIVDNMEALLAEIEALSK